MGLNKQQADGLLNLACTYAMSAIKLRSSVLFGNVEQAVEQATNRAWGALMKGIQDATDPEAVEPPKGKVLGDVRVRHAALGDRISIHEGFQPATVLSTDGAVILADLAERVDRQGSDLASALVDLKYAIRAESHEQVTARLSGAAWRTLARAAKTAIEDSWSRDRDGYNVVRCGVRSGLRYTYDMAHEQLSLAQRFAIAQDDHERKRDALRDEVAEYQRLLDEEYQRQIVLRSIEDDIKRTVSGRCWCAEAPCRICEVKLARLYRRKAELMTGPKEPTLPPWGIHPGMKGYDK